MLIAGRFETVPLTELTQKGLHPDAGSRSIVALIVDNEEIIADTRAAILANWGYTVLTAYDAESAIEIARMIPPELLIADVILPQMNGVELASAINAIVPDCKVVLISARIEGQDFIAAALQLGYELTVVTKPVHPAQLSALLAELQLPSPQLQFPELAFSGVEMHRAGDRLT